MVGQRISGMGLLWVVAAILGVGGESGCGRQPPIQRGGGGAGGCCFVAARFAGLAKPSCLIRDDGGSTCIKRGRAGEGRVAGARILDWGLAGAGEGSSSARLYAGHRSSVNNHMMCRGAPLGSAADGAAETDSWGGERDEGDPRDDADCEALAKREAAAAAGRLRTSRKKNRMDPDVDKKKESIGLKKMIAQREDDPEEIELVRRQRVLAGAMELLGKWDEEQEEYTLANGDPNAPLGDWTGFRRQLTVEEREEMRRACKVLCEDAAYVLVGFNAMSEEQALRSMDQWLEGLGLPKPVHMTLTDDDMSGTWDLAKEGMNEELLEKFKGPIHIAYNSRAGADPVTGSDADAPAKAAMMPYPASDR